MNEFSAEIIVIGAGHAGIEAANAAATKGHKVILITLKKENIGALSCNPAVGGVAKGHLVREVDALGGLIAKITDQVSLGFRRLNKSKGKAVWATRAQVDMFLYPSVAQQILFSHPNISIVEAEVKKILITSGRVQGVETKNGEKFYAKAVIICSGTFLGGKIHIGLENFPGGRISEPASIDLWNNILDLGFKTNFFKTGTCARLDYRTINFSKMQIQYPDQDVEPFSVTTEKLNKEDWLPCYIGYTNKTTHSIILDNLDKSPLYTGIIKACGVRYCPSLEDKIVKFPGRERHHIFFEPTGKNSIEIYPNGVSTSLPANVQEKFLRTIEGLEKVVIIRPGYGIEHGIIDSRQLLHSLQAEKIKGLFFAGQVNGTTGYEEAAAQGIIAGINAALFLEGKPPFILSRQEAFIGVLIDDLVTKGTNEPYRMFTSRSEYRLTLRESNADIRLSYKAYDLGLVDSQFIKKVEKKLNYKNEFIKKLKKEKIFFEGNYLNASRYLKQPKTNIDEIIHLNEPDKEDYILKLALHEAEIEIKYEGFIEREKRSQALLNNFSRVNIPSNIDYSNLPFLSKEIREKLSSYRPKNLKEALSISGVTPAAIINLYNYLQKRKKSA